MIAKAITVRQARVDKEDPIFRQTCMDILSSETSRIGTAVSQKRVKRVINELIDQIC